MTSEPALTFTEKDRTELAMLADDYDAVPNAHDGRLIARAAAYIEQLVPVDHCELLTDIGSYRLTREDLEAIHDWCERELARDAAVVEERRPEADDGPAPSEGRDAG